MLNEILGTIISSQKRDYKKKKKNKKSDILRRRSYFSRNPNVFKFLYSDVSKKKKKCIGLIFMKLEP